MSMLKTAQRWMARAARPAARERAEAAPQRMHCVELVHQAWQQWQAAQNYFESVSDPELIDYAIYDVEATRRKYIYMLKQAEREMNAYAPEL